MQSTPQHTENEKLLLQQVASGNEQAFRQLFQVHHRKVYSFAFGLTRSAVMAEEITQEIFLKIWVHRNQLADLRYFNAWLKTLVRNLTYTWLRRMSLEELILKDIGHRSERQSDDTENAVLLREFSRLVQQAVDQLPPRQKEVYLLSRQQGLPHAVIASQLNISPNTVKQHMKSALHSIRRFLEKHGFLLAPAILVFCSQQ